MTAYKRFTFELIEFFKNEIVLRRGKKVGDLHIAYHNRNSLAWNYGNALFNVVNAINKIKVLTKKKNTHTEVDVGTNYYRRSHSNFAHMLEWRTTHCKG